MSDMAAPRGKYTMEQLQQGITDLILDRGLRIGDPVPPESELREVFGVSRNSLREALKMLQAVGIVEIRHGYGTFVAGHPLTALRRTLQFRARLSCRVPGWPPRNWWMFVRRSNVDSWAVRSRRWIRIAWTG